MALPKSETHFQVTLTNTVVNLSDTPKRTGIQWCMAPAQADGQEAILLRLPHVINNPGYNSALTTGRGEIVMGTNVGFLLSAENGLITSVDLHLDIPIEASLDPNRTPGIARENKEADDPEVPWNMDFSKDGMTVEINIPDGFAEVAGSNRTFKITVGNYSGGGDRRNVDLNISIPLELKHTWRLFATATALWQEVRVRKAAHSDGSVVVTS
ncbi:hypothetical protein C8R43DRAFT_950089 [Mycena crocata]|nr:hypothetical protein C8R43DRAFT_950089 [Mycena crocata]